MAGASDAADGAGGGKAKKPSLVSLIVEFVAVAAIAAGAGAATAFLQGAPASTPAAETTAAKAAPVPEKALVELPPIVTNIASPADLWIRVEASVVVDGKAAATEVLAAEIATDALAYLRTLTIAQIEGPIGLENIRQDLTERAVVRSKGKVSEFILKTLVVQ
jgi:flagellar protein FliL